MDYSIEYDELVCDKIFPSGQRVTVFKTHYTGGSVCEGVFIRSDILELLNPGRTKIPRHSSPDLIFERNEKGAIVPVPNPNLYRKIEPGDAV